MNNYWCVLGRLIVIGLSLSVLTIWLIVEGDWGITMILSWGGNILK